jgi:hypothetical protein
LAGRIDHSFGSFPVKTLAKFLDELGQLHEQNLLNYKGCGGIPRYVELMTDSDCLERSKLSTVFLVFIRRL